MTEGYPSYYSITPATVRYDYRLKPYERLLFGEITALSNVKGYCYSTNKYFADLYHVAIPTISKWVNHLKELGYLRVEMIKEGKAIKERHLYPVVDPINQKVNTPINQKVKRGINRKVKENNTSINNTSNNNTTTTEQLNKPKNAFEKYQIYVGMLNAIQTPVLIDYVQRLGDEVVSYAIDNMLDYTNKPNFKYLRKILDKYEQLGIDSVEKAKELDEKHSKKQEEIHQARNNRYVGRKPRQEKMPYWYHEKDNSEKKDETKLEKTETKSEIARLMQKINGDDGKNE